MKATENQLIILKYCDSHDGMITKKEACTLIKYYNNTEKYVGEILSRMVKNNQLKRIKNGIYKKSSGVKQNVSDPNQTQLL